MTFWHYHHALMLARKLDLTTRETLAFAHLAQCANPAGVVAFSIESMAADVGLDRRDFGRVVRKLWTQGAIYASGQASRGRAATVYRLVPEEQARALVEADRAARRQPGQGAPVEPGQGAPSPDQPGQSAPVGDQPGQGAPVQPGQGAPDWPEPSPGGFSYVPRLRAKSPTGAGRPGWDVQPGQGAPQPGQGAPHYKYTILNHERAREAPPRPLTAAKARALARCYLPVVPENVSRETGLEGDAADAAEIKDWLARWQSASKT